MRKRIYEVIEAAKGEDVPSRIYDIFMMAVILLSLIPLTMKNPPVFFNWTEKITAGIFIVDYLLRLVTADFKLNKGVLSFVRYPFTFMAIVDLLSILPSFTPLSHAFQALRVVRLARTFRVFRMFKVFRYSKNIDIILTVFREQKKPLIFVCCLAVGYILATALILFNVEPDTFSTFFDAVYWATVSLTTVGYGDIYAVSTAGKVITMLSSVFGIAIVALPAGILTAGYMKVVHPQDD